MKIIKKILILCMLFCSHSYATKVATVELKDNRIFQIASQSNNIGSFEISLQNDKQVIRDGECISFIVRVKNIKINDTTLCEPILFRCDCNNEIIEQGVELTRETNGYASGNIENRFHKDCFLQKKNTPFNVVLKFSLPDYPNIVFDDVELIITPEFSITVDRPVVDFGTLTYDKDVVSGPEQSVSIQYCVFNSARCHVFSQNGFCILHKKTKFPIQYNVASENLTENDQEKIITLKENNQSCIMKISVNYHCLQMPTPGNYEDSITLTIKPDE